MDRRSDFLCRLVFTSTRIHINCELMRPTSCRHVHYTLQPFKMVLAIKPFWPTARPLAFLLACEPVCGAVCTTLASPVSIDLWDEHTTSRVKRCQSEKKLMSNECTQTCMHNLSLMHTLLQIFHVIFRWFECSCNLFIKHVFAKFISLKCSYSHFIAI